MATRSKRARHTVIPGCPITFVDTTGPNVFFLCSEVKAASRLALDNGLRHHGGLRSSTSGAREASRCNRLTTSPRRLRWQTPWCYGAVSALKFATSRLGLRFFPFLFKQLLYLRLEAKKLGVRLDLLLAL